MFWTGYRTIHQHSWHHVGYQLNVHPAAVWWVWRYQQLYLFHPQKVQVLQPADFANRIAFCQWYFERCAIEPEVGRFILFTLDEILNSHNQNVWADVNQKESIVRHHQESFCHNLGRNCWWSFDWADYATIESQRCPISTVPAVHIAWVDPRCFPWHPESPVIPAWWRNPSFFSWTSRAFTWHIRRTLD